MSKLRQEVDIVEGDVRTPEEGDLTAWVVFTRLKTDGPHRYAGWLDAVDDAMALQYACEHYGQDQECVSLCVIPRDAISGTDPQYTPSDEPGAERPFVVFIQTEPGADYRSEQSVTATDSAVGLALARQCSPAARNAHHVWVVDCDRIVHTDDDDVIWRFTDQTYRLARGYSSAVREKWAKVRYERDISEYEKDDLKECF